MKKYSVLMSVYKSEKADYMKAAVDSMLNQTLPPNEIVIVEDGPLTDELYGLIEGYKTEYGSLFKIVVNETNLGLGKALNHGLANCSNELVARMDTDDISLPDRCGLQLEMMQKDESIDIVGGNIIEFSGDIDNVVGVRKVPCEHDKIISYMKKRCPLNHVSVMFKKQAVIDVGGYIDWFYNEDYYLWIRMAESGCRFANIDKPFVRVRVGNDMYLRRGGKKYFKSEVDIQKYMLKKHIIGYGTYCVNVLKRFILQRLLCNKMRKFVYKHFARKTKVSEDL